MPFVNGKYYMNPFHGVALARERLRAADGQDAEPEIVSATGAQPRRGDHWVTIDHRHVLIEEANGARDSMSLSPKGLEFVKRHEGLKLKPYLDAAGYKTIGYGHKILRGEDYSDGITEEQATVLLRRDVQYAVDAVNASLKRPLSQNQFDALVDLAFNEGPVSVPKGNEMMRAVNAGHVSESNFTAYRYVKVKGRYGVSQGLLNRREREWVLYSKGRF